MQKLQQMIDAAFPGKEAERTPQSPSDGFVERERQFAATAAKVEALRQTRAEGNPELPSLLFEVVRHRGHWRILHKNRHSPPFADQTAALTAAVKKAKAKCEAGFAVEVRLNRTDGEVIPQPLDEETSKSPPAGS